ncbi:MAG: CDP-alcohol phosphatidyltransferase family protein [Thiotrichaceae bacterium]|nr:CDP-alcohol phosphatidyltransferase family protein [Thiotrichaceae bacterium]
MLHSLYKNIPNIVSGIRILMVPVLVYLAISQQAIIYIMALIFTELTDVLDGYLARRLKLVSELGAQLDSWGDFLVYTTMTISAWLLWPDIVYREQIYIAIIISCFTLPVLIGLIKFKTFISYHTLGTKVAVFISVIAYLLLFTGLLDWPVKVAAVFCLYAAIEEIMIVFISDNARSVDVKSIWHVLKEKQQQSIS